ncbi:hypothetical protein JXA47_07295 [Candidatus Sumerlaeota bacterium]|nr:hypothetical protein [Candidatus Sumerlaeota bacterium]
MRSLAALSALICLCACAPAVERHAAPTTPETSPSPTAPPPSEATEIPDTSALPPAQWLAHHAPAACWFALAETPSALGAAWPVITGQVTYLQGHRPDSVAPAWIAVEMSSFPPETQTEAWAEACAALGEEERRALAPSESWVERWDGIGNRLHSLNMAGEMMLAAAFTLEPTRGAFDTVIAQRGLDPERVTGEEIAASASSAEHITLIFEIQRRLVMMSDEDLEAWIEAVASIARGISL